VEVVVMMKEKKERGERARACRQSCWLAKPKAAVLGAA